LLDPGKELVVGRTNGCHLLIDDPSVSRRHASILRRGASDAERPVAQLEDLGSANGTFLDGERITGKVAATIGQVIVIGGEQIEVAAAEPGEVLVRVAAAVTLSPPDQKGRDDTTLTGIERTDTMLDGCERLVRGGRWQQAADALASALPDVIASVEQRPGAGPEALRRASRCFASVAQHGHGASLVAPILRLHDLIGAVPDEAAVNALRAVAPQDDATRALRARFVQSARQRRLSAGDLKRLERIDES
jgi:hypothetical protein